MSKATGKKAIFVCSQKGGTGKSTFARAAVDHLRGKGVCLAAFDTDPKVGQLGQFYGLKTADGSQDRKANLSDWSNGVVSFDIRDKDGVGTMADALDLDADVLLFDMPGGSIDDMKEVFGNMDIFLSEYKKEGYEVWVIVVLTTMLASSNNIPAVISTFGPDAKYVAVKNLGFGDENSFDFFDGPCAARAGFPDRALKAVGGKVISMPAMQSNTYAIVDADSLKFSEAAVSTTLSRTHRTRVAYWLQDMGKNIDSAGL